MKALDLLIEKKQLNDRSNDSSSRAFSREVNDPALKSKANADNQAHQDKVTVATCSFMFGGPFMFLGLGAALFDQFSAFKRSLTDLKNANPRLNPLRKSLSLKDEIEQKPLKLESPEGPSMNSVLLSMDLNQDKEKKIKKSLIRDRVLFLDPRRNGARDYLSAQRNRLEASKLVRRKQFLVDEIERINNGPNYAKVTNLISKVELLDKALKRLGC